MSTNDIPMGEWIKDREKLAKRLSRFITRELKRGVDNAKLCEEFELYGFIQVVSSNGVCPYVHYELTELGREFLSVWLKRKDGAELMVD